MLSLKRHKKLIILIICFLIIIWCGIIFTLSSMTSQNSNEHSMTLVEQGIAQILKLTNEYEITNAYLSEESIAHAAILINAPLRKVAHATVYFVLALLLLIISRITFGSRKYLLSCILTLLFCFAFAMTDEFHQTFVDGRTGQFMDVIIDTAGACLSILLFSSYYLVWRLGQRNARKNLQDYS